VLIALFIKVKVLPEELGSEDELLQNFLVVLEMFLFAVAHYFVFSHKPYIDPAAAQVPCFAACLRMLDIRDVAGDVKEHFVDPIPRPKFRHIIRTSATGSSSNMESDEEKMTSGVDTENSPLLKKTDKKFSLPALGKGQGQCGSGEELSGVTERHHFSDRSYDILSYKEWDSKHHPRSRSSSGSASLPEAEDEQDKNC